MSNILDNSFTPIGPHTSAAQEMSCVLPDKPSALIRLALSDMEKTVARGIKINMTSWIDFDDEKTVCGVCFAGAVLLETCGVATSLLLSSILIKESKLRRQMWALDAFRNGEIWEGLAHLRLPIRGLPRYVVVHNYFAGAELFQEDMNSMAAMFEAAGL